MLVASVGHGNKYFITYIDDCIDAIWVYYLYSKDQQFAMFKEFKALVETQYNTKICVFRSDRGGKYQSNEFTQYLKDNGI